MNYLIDTHILLWYMVGDKRISKDTQTKIENNSNTIYLSNASLWEIAIKVSIGKLKLKGNLTDLKNYLIDKGFILLEFDYDDLETLLTLPFHHQDPFDRLIIAQSKTKIWRLLPMMRRSRNIWIDKKAQIGVPGFIGIRIGRGIEKHSPQIIKLQ